MSAPEPARAAEPPEIPYWDWSDAGMFLLLAVPSFLLALAFSKGLALLAGGLMGKAATALAFQFTGYGLWFGALYLMLRARYEQPFWPSLGWRVPWRNPLPALFMGPALALSVAILGVLLKTPDVQTPFRELLSDRTSIVLVGFFAVTLGPLCEELLFRGFFLPLLVRSLGAALGVVACALPFALLHGPQYGWSWRHVLLLTLAATVFGITRLRTGSTAASTLVHATYNLTFFTGFLLQERGIAR